MMLCMFVCVLFRQMATTVRGCEVLQLNTTLAHIIIVCAFWTATSLSTVIRVTCVSARQSTTGTATSRHTGVVQHPSKANHPYTTNKTVFAEMIHFYMYDGWLGIKKKDLTTLRDMWSKINGDSMFCTEVSIMSQCSAQTAAPTATGLIAALLLVDVWTDVTMTWSKHTSHQHLTLGCVEY